MFKVLHKNLNVNKVGSYFNASSFCPLLQIWKGLYNLTEKQNKTKTLAWMRFYIWKLGFLLFDTCWGSRVNSRSKIKGGGEPWGHIVLRKL
jgi:hypothetical protein